MPLETALSTIDTAALSVSFASPAFVSTAVRAFFTAVRSLAIAARLRARFLIILRFCFWADLILAIGDSCGGDVYPPGARGVKGLRVIGRGEGYSHEPGCVGRAEFAG